MISYHNFTILLENLLLDPLYLAPMGYQPSHITKIENFTEWLHYKNKIYSEDINGDCTWSHEEPLNSEDLKDLSNLAYNTRHPDRRSECRLWRDIGNVHEIFYDVNFHLFANSEKSDLKTNWLKSFKQRGSIYHSYYDWYFFFHGFVALDWYRDYKILQNPSNFEITNVFITLNHLLSNKRSYRLHLLSLLHAKKLINHGQVSAPLLSTDIIENELLDNTSSLSSTAKKEIYIHLMSNASPLIIDTTDYNAASAYIPDYVYKSMWWVVTETVYFDNKLHLTEKIFKAIVTKRPFILVSSPGNLAYLKSYGFKTFDYWIDESYDNEPNHTKRMHMIVNELEKLCKLSIIKLRKMYNDMQEILDYNHKHFYTSFKNIIINEMIDNFETCVKIYNLNKSNRFRVPIENINFDEVKEILLS